MKFAATLKKLIQSWVTLIFHCCHKVDYDIDNGSRLTGQGNYADVVELVDTLDLGSSGVSHGGSSPFVRTRFPDMPGFVPVPAGLLCGIIRRAAFL